MQFGSGVGGGAIDVFYCFLVVVTSTPMDVPEGAYGAYAYAPGVGLRITSDYFCNRPPRQTMVFVHDGI